MCYHIKYKRYKNIQNRKVIGQGIRPVNIFFNGSQIGWCINYQFHVIYEFALSKYQWGFGRGYNAQHGLITLIQKWMKKLYHGRV